MDQSFSRLFLVIGAGYLLIGVGLGMWMGGTGEFRLAPVHAHINLVGFVLMTAFGLILRVIPGMATSALARWHFWAFQVGTLILVIGLYLLISERMAESTVGPVMLMAEVLVVLGLLAFGANLWKHA